MTSSFYKEYPKTCDPEDFWGQVRRTVNGKPVPQEHIDMIVEAVCEGLDLRRDDRFLDICCGNGALTSYFFERCAGGLGVDFSEFLIEVANKHFAEKPQNAYLLQDILEFARTFSEPGRFTKGMCYGSLQYLGDEAVHELLAVLHARFDRLGRLFIGNVPDRRLVREFFGEAYQPGIERKTDSAIGVWRSEEDFEALVRDTGWKAEVRHMPKDYYTAHYRYDVLLTRTRG